MANKDYLTVEQFNTYVNNIFNHEEMLHNVPIVGEVSGCSVSGGHCYFTLKDAKAQISVVCFDCKRTYVPKVGEQVLVRGKADFYIKGGKLSIKAYTIEPFGIGKLFVEFERLKEKLKGEGLFDEKYKKSVPVYPNKVAIITSSKGAALQDILRTIYNKNLTQSITIIDVRVQGESSAKDITKALKHADELDFDVIVITRGGGSFEDLFSFNNEELARAVFDAKTPIISAIGHETDYTLCDFVADERVITPTAAAERIGYDIEGLKKVFVDNARLLSDTVTAKFLYQKEAIYDIVNNISHKWRLLLAYEENKLNTFNSNMKAITTQKIDKSEQKIGELLNRLESLSPTKLLKKGYFRLVKNNEMLSTIKEIEIGDEIDIYAADGKANATIKSKEIQNEL